jgi:perosamine synthetase
MTDVHAALGVAQLSRLGDFIDARNTIFKQYDQLIAPWRKQLTPSDAYEVAPWLYTMMLESMQQRDFVASQLAKQDIETRPVFVPLHRQPMYRRPDDQFPVSSFIADRGISLPTFVGLTSADVARVADAVNACLVPQLRLAKG